MQRRSAFNGLPLAGTAAVGVMLGHWLAYTAAFPATAVRQYILRESGHSYWLTAIRLAVVVVVVGLAVLVGRLARDGAAPRAETFSSIARQLAGVQVAAFASMEVLERLVTGAPLAHMLDHQVFVLGVAAQVVVACAGAFVLRWFGRAASAVVENLRREGPDGPRSRTVAIRPRSAQGVASAGPGRRRGRPRTSRSVVAFRLSHVPSAKHAGRSPEGGVCVPRDHQEVPREQTGRAGSDGAAGSDCVHPPVRGARVGPRREAGGQLHHDRRLRGRAGLRR